MRTLKISLPGLFLLFFTVVTVQAFGQHTKVYNLSGYDDDPFRWGFHLNYATILFTVNPVEGEGLDYYKIYQKNMPGFSVGLITNLRLNNSFDFRFVPALTFGERKLIYDPDNQSTENEPTPDPNQSTGVMRKSLPASDEPIIYDNSPQSSFVEFPFHLRYKGSRYNNVRPYVFSGVKYAMDLSSNSKRNVALKDILVLKRNDLYGDLGGGFDFYTKYFKLGIELKMSYGLFNIMDTSSDAGGERRSDAFADKLESLKSKVFYLTFNFE